MGNTTADQHVVLLTNLNAALLRIELADANPFAHLAQGELLGLVVRKLDNVEPGHIGRFFAMRLQDLGRAVEQALEALDEYRSKRAGAEIAGHALVAVEHALVLAQQLQDARQGVIAGDKGQVLGVLAGEVVDLEVVGGFGRLGRRRRRSMRGGIVRRAALALELLGHGGGRRGRVVVGALVHGFGGEQRGRERGPCGSCERRAKRVLGTR